MRAKEQALEYIKEFFLVTQDHLYKDTVKNDFSLLYDEWEKRGYIHLKTTDLLDIKKLNLSMLGMKFLLDEFGYLSTLESFNISGNLISELPESLWNLHNLKELYLGSPVFGGNNITNLSANIRNLENLEILDISLCDNLTTLPKELLQLENLSYLRLTQDNLYNSDIVQILKTQNHCNVLLEETLPPISSALSKQMNSAKFRVIDKPIYFSDALEAQEYAKKNLGVTITRTSPDEHQVTEHTPQSILQYLNKSIIAQDDAKKEVALTLYYHSLKGRYKDAKQNQSSAPLMLIGPTGTGKTFIVQQACEFLSVLFIHVDTSSMVSEGIVGYNIGKLAADILKKAELNTEKAEHCVVFFDEMDKLFHPDGDQYGSEVSHQLLRFIEGTTINIPKQDADGVDKYKLNTHKMQFILGGAFQWIVDKKESNLDKSLGFLQDNSPTAKKTKRGITLEELYKEDVPKELLGRMHTIVNLYPLTQEDYYKILTQSDKSPLQEFIDKITFHGDSVIVDEDVLQAVAKYAVKSDLGVRSLRQILKKLFNNALFLAPGANHKTHHIKYNKENFYE